MRLPKSISGPLILTYRAKSLILNRQMATNTLLKRTDSDDLRAFDESFSSEDSLDQLFIKRTSRHATPKKNGCNLDSQPETHTRKESFEDDFNTDFTDNDELEFNMSEIQLSSPIKKSLGDKVPLTTESTFIEISAPETSSPEFHRTETKNVNIKIKWPTPPITTSTQEAVREMPTTQPDDLPPPSLINNIDPPKTRNMLYPQLDLYNMKYNIPQKVAASKTRIPKQDTHIFCMTQRPDINILNQSRRIQARNLSSIVDGALLDQTADESELPNVRSHSKPVKTVIPMTLSPEQEKVQDLVLNGHSLFYTGSAGTGKSILLRSIIKSLKKKYRNEEGAIAVTASTGLAAVNIGGSTLHSFAGIGLGKEPYQELARKIKTIRKSRTRWTKCKVLIIDEISMISGELFEKLDQIACTLRGNDDPFGGIQIVACGDFFQLPPVVRDDEHRPNRFCFHSDAWKRTMKLCITLTKVFRQKGDLEFIEMLNEMRLGKVSNEAVKKFKELERELPIVDGIAPAELFPTRSEVDRANYHKLKNINQLSEVYHAIDGGVLDDPDHRGKLLSNFMAPARLELKKGAQVMMIKNIDENLVNGSLGKVVDFLDGGSYLAYNSIRENVDLDNEFIMRKALQKRRKDESKENVKGVADVNDNSDHISLDDVSSDGLDGSIFEFLDEIETNDEEALSNIHKKKKLIKQLQRSSRGTKLPLVKFLTPDGSSRTVLVQQEIWTVEDEKGDPLVSRIQLPLILAWSLSIHKSQGQTLPKVKVNLGKVFEKGQAYVALSRAVSREGLQVLNFNRDRVFAHPDVLDFYDSLKDVNHYFDKEGEEEAIENSDMEEKSEEMDILAAQHNKRRKYGSYEAC